MGDSITMGKASTKGDKSYRYWMWKLFQRGSLLGSPRHVQLLLNTSMHLCTISLHLLSHHGEKIGRWRALILDRPGPSQNFFCWITARSIWSRRHSWCLPTSAFHIGYVTCLLLLHSLSVTENLFSSSHPFHLTLILSHLYFLTLSFLLV